MSTRHVAGSVRDLVLRMFPHRAPTGLRAVGDPGPESPVAVTGNFTLTVRRLEAALRGFDVWVLVANSRGINVWCAAGGGHLTHHDVIAAIRTSGLAERVRHRRLILPQLAATGVERRRVEEATGFRAVWGPASLEDLPTMLRRGGVRRRDRLVRFPLRDRLEMACVWALPMAAVGAAALFAAGGARLAALGAAGIPAMVAAVFAGIPRLPVVGPRRWWTFGGVAGAAALAGAWVLAAAGEASPGAVLAWTATCLVSMGLLSLDVAGTTPLYPSSANTLAASARIDLAVDRCTGAAECVQVCPKGVLEMNGRARRVEIRRPEACIACGACVVQCPEDALRFRFPDGRTVEAATIRSTRTNLLGRRTVRVSDGG